jgi:hypothetical protein
MSDSGIAKSFFEIGIVLTLASMVFGPFEINDWSIACGATACFLAVAGIYFAFESWKEPDTPPQAQAKLPQQEQNESKEK